MVCFHLIRANLDFLTKVFTQKIILTFYQKGNAHNFSKNGPIFPDKMHFFALKSYLLTPYNPINIHQSCVKNILQQ